MIGGGKLDEKVALITGASSGIGQAIAEAYAREGARLHLTGRDADRLARVASALERQPATWTALDLADTAHLGSLVDAAIEHHGRLDIVVNCGAMVDDRLRVPAGETSLEVWNLALAINVTAPFVLSRAAIEPFREAGGGAIVNIASIGGLGAFPAFCPYVVSKAALIGLTRSMALDYGNQGIRVNAIAPGAIDTPQVADEPDRPAYLKRIAGLTALDRIGLAVEVARAAVFLASSEASYITGDVLVVDGGRTVRA